MDHMTRENHTKGANSRPGSGEAHGQQDVQAGATLHGARPGLPESPREDLGVQVLSSGHDAPLRRTPRWVQFTVGAHAADAAQSDSGAAAASEANVGPWNPPPCGKRPMAEDVLLGWTRPLSQGSHAVKR